VTKPFPTKNLRFFLTAPSPCPYLPGRKERKVFTALDGFDAGPLHDVLTNAGFRRSQNIAYRPSCEGCDACISARVPVERFTFGRRWRKIMLRNADLARSLRPAQATEEQFRLLRRYLQSRHAEGGMAEMTFTDFAAMVEESAVHTHVVEYRFSDGAKRGQLAGVALVDALGDGLSMVYSFFDPQEIRRSLGVYTILDHIQQARAAGFAYVYLGYWIPGSDKMDYKADFRPLELLLGGEWRPYEPVEF
jgi:arginine-tRNA-protein transferase